MHITRTKLSLLLLLPLAVLLTSQVLLLYFKFALGYDSIFGFVRLFEFGDEANIPTWYSAILLITAAGIAFLCGHEVDAPGLRRYWWGLAAIFVFLSLDETAQLHELSSKIIRLNFESEGIFFWPWVLPFGIIALLVGGIYVRFLLLIPPRTAVTFVGAGGFYVAGAIGFEIVAALFAEAGDTRSLTVRLLVTIEEFLEMCGPSLFIWGAHNYLQSRGAKFHLFFERT